jgi:hypothetical protein
MNLEAQLTERIAARDDQVELVVGPKWPAKTHATYAGKNELGAVE